jgi:hypothetical protein
MTHYVGGIESMNGRTQQPSLAAIWDGAKHAGACGHTL